MIALTIGRDRIADVRFDAPGEKVNLLNEAALAKLGEILAQVEAGCRDRSIRAVIVTSGKKGVFLAGADVKAFVAVARAGDPAAAAARAGEGQALFSRIAALPVPTIAAINGACLGGGLELALACTARVAGDAGEVSIGLPEVRLGLIPGWGGTQRLPRLVGLSRALDLILTGRSLTGRKAVEIGLVDAVVPIEGIEHAARLEAARLAAGARPLRPAWSWLDTNPLGHAIVLSMARRRALQQSRGHYPAPLTAIDVVRYGLKRGIEEGLRYEAEQVGRLLVGDVSKNLVGVFLVSRGSSPSSTTARPISRIGVLGAGTMGGGIAAVAAMNASVAVRLKDVDAGALAHGMTQLRALANEASRKGRLPRHEALRREALVAPTIDWSGFSRCDLVIEAVVEDLEVKRQVLREMEAATGPRTIFATNTSSLSVKAIAASAAHPGRVLGLHFFNPVEKMPLVEVVRGPATDDAAVEAALALSRRMGKTPVVVKDTPGFIVNRILMPYLAGAVETLGRSGDPRTVSRIDSAMVDFGMPMGPFALLDQIGIDVAAKVAGVLRAAFPEGSPERNDGARLLLAMKQGGLLGVKSYRGFYRYSGGRSQRGKISPELAHLLFETYRPPVSSEPAAERVAELLIDSMINEAALLLDEGAVERPEVIDLAMIFGAGFPPFRGGLLRHADTIGREIIAARINARGIAPAPLLARKGRFYE